MSVIILNYTKMTKWGFQKTASNRKRLISNDGNKKNTFCEKYDPTK